MTERNLHELARLIDDAMCSDDPRVRRAFARLMTTVALVADPDRTVPGPFQSMINHVDSLTHRIRELEIKEQQKDLPFSKYMHDWN